MRPSPAPRRHAPRCGSAGWFLVSVPRRCSPKAMMPSSWDRSYPASATNGASRQAICGPPLRRARRSELGASSSRPWPTITAAGGSSSIRSVVFGVLTIATVFATTITEIVILRLLTGLGLGGAMANTTALTAEFSPPRRRAFYVAMMFCSFSLGASFGGFVAAELMPAYGWGSIFCLRRHGDRALPVLIALLPESSSKRTRGSPFPAAKPVQRGSLALHHSPMDHLLRQSDGALHPHVMVADHHQSSGRRSPIGLRSQPRFCNRRGRGRISRWRLSSTAMARASCFRPLFDRGALGGGLGLCHVGSGHRYRRGRRRDGYGRGSELQQRHRRQVLPT